MINNITIPISSIVDTKNGHGSNSSKQFDIFLRLYLNSIVHSLSMRVFYPFRRPDFLYNRNIKFRCLS